MILPPLAAPDHACGDRLKREEQALHIDGEDPVIALLGDLLDRRHVEDGGIVDEDVDATRAFASTSATMPIDRFDPRDIEMTRQRRRRPMSRAVARARIIVDIGDADPWRPHAHSLRAMARPMPRAPPVTTAILPSSLIADRSSLAIEAMDAAFFRRQPDLAARALTGYSPAARTVSRAAFAGIDMQERVGAEMLGERDRAFPFSRLFDRARCSGRMPIVCA